MIDVNEYHDLVSDIELVHYKMKDIIQENAT